MGRPPLHGAAAGGKVSRLYRIWSGMKCRCHTRTSVHFPRYGAPNGETTAETAKRLGVTPQTIRHRLKIGMLPREVVALAKTPNGGMRKHFRKHHTGKWNDTK